MGLEIEGESRQFGELLGFDMALELIKAEWVRANVRYRCFHSPHEGLAILLEEVHELQAEVFTSARLRSEQRMKKDAVRVAAMALRFLTDLCPVDK